MADSPLIIKSKRFALEIIKICDSVKTEKRESVLTNQLLRSGTSIGANVHEANYAQSKADFISKLQIALKECYETEYWLKLFEKSEIVTAENISKYINDCGKIRRLLISSVNTAKTNK